MEKAEAPVFFDAAVRRRPGPFRKLLRFFRTKPLGAAGGLVVALLVIVAIFAPLVAPHEPNQLSQRDILKPPSAEFFFGTDDFGRDIFSRIVYGSRISLYVGIFSMIAGTTSGALLGLLGGYFGGRTDNLIQRVMDVMMAFPMLVLALAIVAVLGASLNNVILAIAFPIVPRAARVVRSSALTVKQNQYVDAAKAMGCGDGRIIFMHILPNCTAPYIVLATAQLGGAILVEASLSFLGLGVPPPHPTWGSMLTGAAQRFAQTAPWMAVYPGIAISLAVFGFNLLGDALRDVLDPRLRRG
ncbi:MAG: ABC transporter permease [Chloroflexi bacterium]|nr:ABC transporter permease [Chloroflexota bacterium]